MHTRRTNRNFTEETEAIYAHWGQIGGKWTQEDNKMLLKLIKAITGLGKDCRPNKQIEEDSGTTTLLKSKQKINTNLTPHKNRKTRDVKT